MKRLLMAYPIFLGGICITLMTANTEYQRADVVGFIGASSVGLWIVAAILCVRR